MHGLSCTDPRGIKGRDLPAEVRQQGDHRIGAALGTHGKAREVVAAHVGGRGHHRGGSGGRQGRAFQDRGPGGLHPENGGQDRPVPGQRRHERRRRDGTE